MQRAYRRAEDGNPLPKLFLFLLLVVLLQCSVPVRAELVEGKDYVLVPDAEKPSPGAKIEVLVFFWYGCPYCKEMYPLLQKWMERKPEDVHLMYVPAYISKDWLEGMRVFYALDLVGELERMHGEVFDAVQRGELSLQDERGMVDWMASKGVDARNYQKAWDSDVGPFAKWAAQLGKRFEITGVPTVVVDRRYLTSGRFTGSVKATVAAMSELVAIARKDRASASK
jgi:thiol:disulfide interchange protein DsbA